ncbi:MAG TPA: pyridoxal phosphate-dependent aminotransferase [Chthoniobacterales bacterium]|nr:pyridoxal phosphate-dependent aminotransferase [Chthoniobacterales bacterium]
MEWAKTCSMARFNLATSGLTNTTTTEFPLAAADMEITGPGGYGFPPLLERLSRHTGAPVESIVAATGASMANYLAMSIVLNAGDEVLIERPAYGLFADIANYLGAGVAYLDRSPENDFSVNVDALEKALTPRTRMIVLSNLHNPSGALLPEATLREIGVLAQRAGVRVLVDEVYLEMLFDRAAPFAFDVGQQLAGSEDNPFIITNSLTKTYGLSGLRCGWILAAPDLARGMWRLNDLFGVNAAHVAEQMSVVAFDRLEILRTKARALLTTNRELLDVLLDAHHELECYRPPGGSVVFPRLPNGDPEAFFRLLREKYETSVVPGHFFGAPRHFRIGIAGSTENVRGGLERLGAALTEFGNR